MSIKVVQKGEEIKDFDTEDAITTIEIIDINGNKHIVNIDDILTITEENNNE